MNVEMETMEVPATFGTLIETPTEPEPSNRRRSSSNPSLRNILSCRVVDVESPETEEALPDFPESLISHPIGHHTPKRATLVLRTRRHNEPLVRVRQGFLKMKNLELRHISHGIGKFFASQMQSIPKILF